MARRRGSIGAALLTLAALVAACSIADTSGSTTTRPSAPSTTSTTAPEPITSTTTQAATTTTVTTSTSTVGSPTEIHQVDAEIGIPAGEGPFPAVVLLHGGGWVTGDPSVMAGIARLLNQEGYLTVNARYALADFDRPGYPDAVEDVACAVKFARSHEDSDGTVAIIGHSAGAHLGALVALVGDRYDEPCPGDSSPVPERFVGLAGPYDISRAGVAGILFFGDGPAVVPEAWEAGNPQFLTGENPGLSALIMFGDADGLVADRFALDFHLALVEAGADSTLERVESARHNEMRDVDVVGDLILAWLDR